MRADIDQLRQDFDGFVNYVTMELMPRLEATEAKVAELSKRLSKLSMPSESQCEE
jgi:hypothetical protein